MPPVPPVPRVTLRATQGLQPGIDQTEAGTAKDDKFYHDKTTSAGGTTLGSGIGKGAGAPGREQLFPEDPAVHTGDSNVHLRHSVWFH